MIDKGTLKHDGLTTNREVGLTGSMNDIKKELKVHRARGISAHYAFYAVGS